MSDLILAIPLDRASLVEASAGTGKTYALAGLFARAVIVRRLRVPQILAVTYTIAATAELHARVRSRLKRASELAAQWREGDPVEREGDRAEVALLRRLLHAALHDGSGESLPALRLRLGRAVREMDLAAITTIHGFCQRVLREHALDAGQAMLAVALQPDNRASRRALAVELWREFAADAQGSDFLRREFDDIDGLAKQMVPLLAPEDLLPHPPASPPDNAAGQVQAAWDGLRAAFARDGAQALADVLAAIDAEVLKKKEYKREDADSLWKWLRTTTADARPPADLHDKFHKYTPDVLRKGIYAAAAKGGKSLQSPLFDALAAMREADGKRIAWRDALDVELMHRLRVRARERDRARKQAFNIRSFDDLVGDVFDALENPETRAKLAAALREQFPLALVDEFQDTDARQWASFQRLFGEAGLVLVGDPKQAIYGFRGGDVHTYLRARDFVGDIRALDRNHRSRPCVVAAVNALFAGMPIGAMGAGIGFQPIAAAREGHDPDYLVDGQPAPALQFHAVPQVGGKDLDAATSLEIAAQLCARAIRDRLQAAHDGRVTRVGKDGQRRPLELRDCAVLVRRNKEAAAVRRALAALGVPAVATGAQSLFDSEAAQELLTLLLALAAPGDVRRLRAMLATLLFGQDAAALCALADDGEALRGWQTRCEAWRLRWEQHGPQAMLADVLAERASDLLRYADGERRLTHLLQLGELMQEARTTHVGIHGQVDWLRAAIDGADDADEAQWPRLESDSGRVQILTLHKSKGLEFPLVFLPFVGIGRSGGGSTGFVSYHDAEDVRVRQWKTGDTDCGEHTPKWKDAKARADSEDDEEAMRLLYVGFTRAIDALWVCGGALSANGRSALHRLLGGNVPDAAMRAKLDIALREDLPDPAAARLHLRQDNAAPFARAPQRRLHRDWWIHSFSQLHRQRPHGTQALVEETPASDERPLAVAVETPRDLRFSGERFGNVLHHALEHTDFAAWRDHVGEVPPPGQDDVLRRALQSQDYRDSDFADGVHALTPLVAATLNAPLPEGTRLCDVTPAQRIAELEFHFTLDDANATALLALLHAHGIARERRDFGAWPRLSGLMTGKIDLTYRVDGRVHVIDYKSNYLSDYDATTLQQAMAASEYDLQALLYAVAVHRWLRLRLGAAYDFDVHLGGVRYLFCRGLDREVPARGMVVPILPRALIEAVDELLAPAGGRA